MVSKFETKGQQSSSISSIKTSSLTLNANRWCAENYDGQAEPVEIQLKSPAESVYVTKCTNSVLVISGKAAAVSIEQCADVGIVVKDDVVSTIEIINSSKVKLQVDSSVPLVSIDNSDSISIYLPNREQRQPEFITAKASEINVFSKKGAKDDEDLHETAIPEQFRSHFDAEGRLVTVPMQHTGG